MADVKLKESDAGTVRDVPSPRPSKSRKQSLVLRPGDSAEDNQHKEDPTEEPSSERIKHKRDPRDVPDYSRDRNETMSDSGSDSGRSEEEDHIPSRDKKQRSQNISEEEQQDRFSIPRRINEEPHPGSLEPSKSPSTRDTASPALANGGSPHKTGTSNANGERKPARKEEASPANIGENKLLDKGRIKGWKRAPSIIEERPQSQAGEHAQRGDKEGEDQGNGRGKRNRRKRKKRGRDGNGGQGGQSRERKPASMPAASLVNEYRNLKWKPPTATRKPDEKTYNKLMQQIDSIRSEYKLNFGTRS